MSKWTFAGCCLAVALSGCSGDPINVGSNNITAAHCRDGKLNNDETDVDCGGKDCNACADGKKCGKDADCTSASCVNGQCEKPCNVSCNFTNGVGKCENGACVLASCNAGFGDCDASQANGCEIDLRVDASNCGACANACVRGEACVNGACKANNLCDPATCKPQNATGQCVNDKCTILACEAGYGDCDASDADGCEVNTFNDPDNCGPGGAGSHGCGVACSHNHLASRTCTRGVCDGTCANGFGDCNQDLQTDGCEVSLVSDAHNCGACGVACPNGQACVNGACQNNNCVCNPPNGVGQCKGGVCALIACNGGFGDCDNDVKDGCEVDLAADALNCGACGVACPQGKRCVAGACM